jgi:hypothetical protein
VATKKQRLSRIERSLVRLSEFRQLDELIQSELREVEALLSSTDAMVFCAAARLVPASRRAAAEALIQAFHYFAESGQDRDPGSKAKFAAVEALSRLEHIGAAVFRLGARLVQKEAAWGPPIDTAAPLRALSGRALVEINALDALDILTDQLTDDEWPVRAAAAASIADLGRPGSAQLLRLKLRLGDDAGDVISACVLGLLHFDSEGGLALCDELLSVHPALLLRDDGTADAIAVALGESRERGAELVLLKWFKRLRDPSSRELALACIAMQRTPEATGVLIEIVRTHGGPDARAAASAMVPYLLTERARQDLLDAAAANESPAVLETARALLEPA